MQSLYIKTLSANIKQRNKIMNPNKGKSAFIKWHNILNPSRSKPYKSEQNWSKKLQHRVQEPASSSSSSSHPPPIHWILSKNLLPKFVIQCECVLFVRFSRTPVNHILTSERVWIQIEEISIKKRWKLCNYIFWISHLLQPWTMEYKSISRLTITAFHLSLLA